VFCSYKSIFRRDESLPSLQFVDAPFSSPETEGIASIRFEKEAICSPTVPTPQSDRKTGNTNRNAGEKCSWRR
jgi:hypothetical protein